jgi:VanZ family protein
MVKLNKYHLFVALTCAYAVFLFYLSSVSSFPGPPDLGFLDRLVQFLEDWGLTILLYPFYLAYRHPDKFAHLILYLGFGLLLNRAASSSQNGIVSKYAAQFSLIIGGLYALTDEVHQAFVPYRTPNSIDLLADFVGLLVAQLLILAYFGIKRFFRE